MLVKDRIGRCLPIAEQSCLEALGSLSLTQARFGICGRTDAVPIYFNLR